MVYAEFDVCMELVALNLNFNLCEESSDLG